MSRGLADGGVLLTAFDLNAKGSLGGWFAIVTLLVAAATAALVYRIRRHRVDDYQGRYRVWLWAAIGCVVMAADEAASLREAFQHLMILLTGSRLLGDGTIWWVSLYTLLFAAVGSRLVIDMRPNWPAIAALALSGVGYGLSMTMRLGWTWLEPGRSETLVRVGAELGANLLLSTTMALHARHVLLDAQGLLPEPEPAHDEDNATEAPSKSATPPESNTTRSSVRIDAPHNAPQSASYRPATTVATARTTTTTTPTNAPLSPVQRKLTKGERRAMKERLLRERTERERLR
jgi:hypothetical protein